jgi:hypothetical protein
VIVGIVFMTIYGYGDHPAFEIIIHPNTAFSATAKFIAFFGSNLQFSINLYQ